MGFFGSPKAAREEKAGIDAGRIAAELGATEAAAKAWDRSADALEQAALLRAKESRPSPSLRAMSGKPFDEGDWAADGAMAESLRARGYGQACRGDFAGARESWAQAGRRLSTSLAKSNPEGPTHHLAHWGRMSILHEGARLGALLPGADPAQLRREVEDGLASRLRMLRSVPGELSGGSGRDADWLADLAPFRERIIRAQAQADLASVELRLGSRMAAVEAIDEGLRTLAAVGPLRGSFMIGAHRPDVGWPEGLKGLAASVELSQGLTSKRAARKGPIPFDPPKKLGGPGS